MATKETTEVLAGVIVDGKVVLERENLPEGTRVAVRLLEPDEDGDTFHLTSEQKVELLDRIAAVQRGEYIDGRAHLQQLHDGV